MGCKVSQIATPFGVIFWMCLRSLPVADFAAYLSLLSRDGLGHLGKGWIVRGTGLRGLVYMVTCTWSCQVTLLQSAFSCRLPDTDLTTLLKIGRFCREITYLPPIRHLQTCVHCNAIVCTTCGVMGAQSSKHVTPQLENRFLLVT